MYIINEGKCEMKKRTRPIDLYLLTLLLLGGGAVVLRTVACLTEWNGEAMHFDNSVCITIANLLTILALLLFATYFIVTKKGESFNASSDTALTYIPSGMVSVALLFISIQKLVERSEPYFVKNPLVSTLSIIIAILGILSVISFFLTVFIQKNESVYKASFNMTVVLFLTIYVAYLYFNKQYHPTNSPAKIVDMMAYLSSAVFFLYESRIGLGRAFWRPYAFFGLTASLLTAYSAIPSIIYYVFNGVSISDTIYESALTLSLCVFITARVILLRNLSHDGVCEAAQCIEALFEMREQQISQKSSHAIEDNNDNNEDNDAESTSSDFENYTMDIPMPEIETDAAATEENI